MPQKKRSVRGTNSSDASGNALLGGEHPTHTSSDEHRQDCPAKVPRLNSRQEQPHNDVILGQLQRTTGTRLRVSLSHFLGRPRIDLRIFFRTKQGFYLPYGEKGVGIPPEQLPALIRLLRLAERAARERGLIPEPIP